MHKSDCALHNAPAYPVGPCDCGAAQKFWMVVGGGPARFRHGTRNEAEIEAKRLARLNPDQWFHVVETVSAHRRNDIESVMLRPSRKGDDDLPF